MTTAPFDLDKVPKAVLIHALTAASLQPPRAWKQDVADLRRTARHGLQSERHGATLRQEIADQLAIHQTEKAVKKAKK